MTTTQDNSLCLYYIWSWLCACVLALPYMVNLVYKLFWVTNDNNSTYIYRNFKLIKTNPGNCFSASTLANKPPKKWQKHGVMMKISFKIIKTQDVNAIVNIVITKKHAIWLLHHVTSKNVIVKYVDWTSTTMLKRQRMQNSYKEAQQPQRGKKLWLQVGCFSRCHQCMSMYMSTHVKNSAQTTRMLKMLVQNG